MAIKNKGDMWAINLVIAVGLIAIFLFGFFVLISKTMPHDVGQVKAKIVEVQHSSQLISLFRIPANNLVLADFVSKSQSSNSIGCSDIENSLRFVYGDSINYLISVDGKKFCSKGAVKTPGALKSGFVLPAYDGSVHNISVEVSK